MHTIDLSRNEYQQILHYLNRIRSKLSVCGDSGDDPADKDLLLEIKSLDTLIERVKDIAKRK